MDILRLDINKAQTELPSDSEVRFQAALLAAIAATAASLIARFAFDAPLVPELMAHLIFAVAPIWIVEIAVGMLGPFAKHLGFLGCLLAYGLALVGVAACFLKYRNKAASRPAVFLLPGLALVLWAATLLVVIPLLGGGLAGAYLKQGAIYSSLSQLAIYAVYGCVLALVARSYIDRPEVALRHNAWLSRRKVMRGVFYSVIAVAIYDMGKSLILPWWRSGSGRVKGGSGAFPDIDGLAMEVTPVPDFYEVSKNPFDPQVELERWSLEIGGLVENRLSLTFDDIKSLPSVEQYATLECIDNKVGGDLIGNALWRGVRLRDILEMAQLKQEAIDIVLRASDGYSDSIPVDRAMFEGTILAYEMNGEPLTPSHGYPLRLIAPGIYGMKNVKWVTRLEAVDFDFKGYWQSRGWDDRAEYKTMSRIDVPDSGINGSATIAGIAFAGDRGISKVEVSTDGGKTWEEAIIKQALSPYSWVLWHKDWTPDRKGKHTLVVRATDGQGITQTSEYSPAAPSGATGHHRQTIEVG
ncbi:MAG TPA: molybdopterin-dependent oxidoreductase [Blastocatellia bacterium]|nr:molybdopterin-dependent oxidoreductase [Blastocatellia bacterium]